MVPPGTLKRHTYDMTNAQASTNPAATSPAQPVGLYGGVTSRRIAIRDLQRAKDAGERWAMLTAYDVMTARLFDECGIPVLLVGDSAGNVVLGHATTVPVTLEDMVTFGAAVVRGASRSMVVVDLPFGSYQSSVTQAVDSAVRVLKETGCQAVKLEGGVRVAAQITALVSAGIPVMAHIGLTPQSEHLTGLRVQGRGEAGDVLLADALAVQEAGAFAVVLEAIPADLAERVTKELRVPTIGIGAGPGTDAQVLVWQDMAGLAGGHTPSFVRRYADLRQVLGDAARGFADDVRSGRFPDADTSYS